jgi:thiamine transport system ATP-binding protein
VRFGDVAALDGADLTVAEGTISAIIGPSGCGKSTLLRVVAGLQTADRGTVTWRDRDLAGVPTHRRGFGLMFQDFALFPHRSVTGNVAFGLRMAGWETDAIDGRVDEVLDLVGLGGFGDRPVAGLSGGEQQRVALARTLAPRPELVMLDEPVASLDRGMRQRLVVEMGEIFAALGVTALYVTHDQEEAFTIADHIAVMDAGRIMRRGTPEEVWGDPRSELVARFLGHDAIVDVTVEEGRAAIGSVDVAVPLPEGRHRLIVPAEAVTLRPVAADPEVGTTGVGPSGVGTGVVRHVAYLGGAHRVVVDAGGIELTGESPGPAPAVGAPIAVTIDPTRLIALTD